MTTPATTACLAEPSIPATVPRLRLTADGPLGPIVGETKQVVTLIGGRRDCDLPLPDPDISKVHCALVYTDAGLLVCDLRSRSGTTLNGASIRSARLQPGDSLKVGSIPIRLEWFAGTAEMPPEDAHLTASSSEQPDPTSVEAVAPSAELVTLEYGGRRTALAGPVALLGNRSTCDLVVDSPDVSLAHALLFRLGGRLVVCDLGSRSGTYRNGQRLSLGWLNPGDQIALADEKLSVLPGIADEPPNRVDRVQSASGRTRGLRSRSRSAPGPLVGALPGPGTLPAEAGDPPNLLEIETSIAALHQYIAAARAELDQRRTALEEAEAVAAAAQLDLDRRQADLAELEQRLRLREAAVQQREGELERQHEHLGRQQQELGRQALHVQNALRKCERHEEELGLLASDLRKRETELLARQGELEQRATAMGGQQAELDQRAAEIARQTAELDERLAELARREEELARDQAACAAQAATLAEQEAILTARAAALEQRSSELDQRARELEQRESAEQETARQITRFATMLREASAALAPMGLGAEGTNLGGIEQNGHAQPLDRYGHETVLGPLPAPVVERPIFTRPAVTTIPPGLPSELHERFRVLRQVSRRSDEELVAHLLAEAQRLAAGRRRLGRRTGDRGK